MAQDGQNVPTVKEMGNKKAQMNSWPSASGTATDLDA